MQTTDTIWQNGKFVPWSEAKIHVLTHALHYGGGAFEGIRFYNTANGPAIFRLHDHIERLFFSAAVLKMNVPYSKDELVVCIKELVKCNKLAAGYIRPIVFYGYNKMGINPVGNPIDVVIACWPWDVYLPYESIDIKISRYTRIHPDSTVVEAKLCGHYVNSILASLELQGTHYHEALFLDNCGHIAEGVGENFFIVKDNTIYTPNSGSILSGITRDTVFKLAPELGFTVFTVDLSLYDIYQADEAFFTGTAAEITAIRSINDKILGNGGVGVVTAKFKQAYLDIVQGNNVNKLSYLTILNNV